MGMERVMYSYDHLFEMQDSDSCAKSLGFVCLESEGDNFMLCLDVFEFKFEFVSNLLF